MRISDWSSDVCSSDLIENHIIASGRFSCPGGEHRADRHHCEEWHGQAQDPPDKGWAEYPGEQRGLQGRQCSRAETDKAHPDMEARSPRRFRKQRNSANLDSHHAHQPRTHTHHTAQIAAQTPAYSSPYAKGSNNTEDRPER